MSRLKPTKICVAAGYLLILYNWTTDKNWMKEYKTMNLKHWKDVVSAPLPSCITSTTALIEVDDVEKGAAMEACH